MYIWNWALFHNAQYVFHIISYICSSYFNRLLELVATLSLIHAINALIMYRVTVMNIISPEAIEIVNMLGTYS